MENTKHITGGIDLVDYKTEVEALRARLAVEAKMYHDDLEKLRGDIIEEVKEHINRYLVDLVDSTEYMPETNGRQVVRVVDQIKTALEVL